MICLKNLLLVATLLCFLIFQATSLKFNYPTFPDNSDIDFFTEGTADIRWNATQVTMDAGGLPKTNLSGRIWYKKSFRLWAMEEKRKATTSFNTTFVLNITPTSAMGGEGLALILTGERLMPDKIHGQWLGIVNSSTNGSALNQIVAVEFDTRKSYAEDLDDNHVGVDVNSIYSIEQKSLGDFGVNLSSAINVTSVVRYDGESKLMEIYVFMTNETNENRRNKPVISIPIDLSEHLPQNIYVGFSASTGDRFTELNCVKSWEFSSIKIGGNSGSHFWVWIIIASFSVLVFMVFGYYLYRKRTANKARSQDRDLENIEKEIQVGTMAPKNFRFKEIKVATKNFKNMLGEGGFGKVYKGNLMNREVAVKRVMESKRGRKKDFLAEVTTIGNLHHRNLVKLLGWCYEHDELILVYEFMPNGSLEKFIYCQESRLNWEKRHAIIKGTAMALDYLHHGCENRVIHRDLKASNIMLDSDFNARLGDFGLARKIELSENTHHSTVEIAGTRGYMAPESFHIRRYTLETDVYGFGVLVLVVSCGRKPNQSEENDYKSDIVEWVWELYNKGRVIEAVDPRLNNEFKIDQLECVMKLALACCHPNPYERPSMRTVLQVLQGEVPPPLLPNEKPAFVWPAASE